MTDTSKEKFNKMQEALDDIKSLIAQIEARRSGKSLPLSEAQMDEAARVDAQKKLGEFREAVIHDELMSHVLSDSVSEREVAFEVDSLLAPNKDNPAYFLEDVAFAPLLGKDIRKGKMLQWLRDYRPFPRHR